MVLLALNKRLLHPVGPHWERRSQGPLRWGRFLPRAFSRVQFLSFASSVFSRHLRGDTSTSAHLHPCSQKTSSLQPTPKHSRSFSPPLPQVSACVRGKREGPAAAACSATIHCGTDNNIKIKSLVLITLHDSILILRKYILKYLEIRGHGVSNLFSSELRKN